MAFEITWYELSGMQTFGLDHETRQVARRGFVLYECLNASIPKRGSWQILGVLTDEQFRSVVEKKKGGNPDTLIEECLIRNGTLVPSGNSTLPATGAEWEAEARQEWLADIAERKTLSAKVNDFAARMELAAQEWAEKNPNAPGGQLDYRLRMKARHIRQLGKISEEALVVALEAGVE